MKSCYKVVKSSKIVSRTQETLCRAVFFIYLFESPLEGKDEVSCVHNASNQLVELNLTFEKVL